MKIKLKQKQVMFVNNKGSLVISDVPINVTAYCFYSIVNIVIVVKISQKSPSREFMLDEVSFLTFLNSFLVNYCKVQSAQEMHLVSSVMIKIFFFTCCIPLHCCCCLLSQYLNIVEIPHSQRTIPRFITWYFVIPPSQIIGCLFLFSEVRLYLMILEKLEHYEKALGVLRSSLAGMYCM